MRWATLKDLAVKLSAELVYPRRADYIGGTVSARDARDLFSRWRRGDGLLTGPYTAQYERALSDYHDGLHVITFGSGSMACYAILKAMDLRPGDQVILPGYTCVVIPNAIRHAGLEPVYVDVSLDDFNLLPEEVERAITPRTRAILAQATFGIPCNMALLLEIGRRHGVAVIEDGAHAVGARWDGKLLGHHGLAAFFSTQATKMYTTERGGFVVTRDTDLAGRIRQIQQHAGYAPVAQERAALLRWCHRAAWAGEPLLNPRMRCAELLLQAVRFPGARQILDYEHDEYLEALAGRVDERAYPRRLPDLMAYAGLLQLRRLDQELKHRRTLAAYLEAELPRLGARVARYDHQRAAPSWVRFPLVVEDRAAWAACAETSGLAAGNWMADPIHPRGSNWQISGYQRGQCPNGEYLSGHMMNVPLHSRVSLRHLEQWARRCRRMPPGA